MYNMIISLSTQSLAISWLLIISAWVSVVSVVVQLEFLSLPACPVQLWTTTSVSPSSSLLYLHCTSSSLACRAHPTPLLLTHSCQFCASLRWGTRVLLPRPEQSTESNCTRTLLTLLASKVKRIFNNHLFVKISTYLTSESKLTFTIENSSLETWRS